LARKRKKRNIENQKHVEDDVRRIRSASRQVENHVLGAIRAVERAAIDFCRRSRPKQPCAAPPPDDREGSDDSR
jgi:hypothetical protein